MEVLSAERKEVTRLEAAPASSCELSVGLMLGASTADVLSRPFLWKLRRTLGAC